MILDFLFPRRIDPSFPPSDEAKACVHGTYGPLPNAVPVWVPEVRMVTHTVQGPRFPSSTRTLYAITSASCRYTGKRVRYALTWPSRHTHKDRLHGYMQLCINFEI